MAFQGVLVDVEAVLSTAAPGLDDDKVTTQAAAASGAEVAVAFSLDDGWFLSRRSFSRSSW